MRNRIRDHLLGIFTAADKAKTYKALRTEANYCIIATSLEERINDDILIHVIPWQSKDQVELELRIFSSVIAFVLLDAVMPQPRALRKRS